VAQIFQIPLTADDVQLTFPGRCVCCGKPKETETLLKVFRQWGNQSPKNISRAIVVDKDKSLATLTLNVPHCARCHAADGRVAILTWIAFFAGAVPGGIVAFILVLLGLAWVDDFFGVSGASPDYGAVQLGLAGALAFIIGGVAGFAAEVVAKVFFTPFLGRALFYAPLLAVQVLGDQEYAAGLTASLTKDFASLQLKFANDEIGQEFGRLNRRA
jgi:hypothetical protein